MQVKFHDGRYVLNIGETAVSSSPGEIICYGLGSCLGVFLYDRFQKVGAGAHIMLPGSNQWRKSDEMLQTIIDGMLDRNCHPLTIRARLVGGANIMNMLRSDIGQRNIEYVREELKKSGIMILAEDIGGVESRTARLEIESGTLSVNNSKKNYYTI
ncbi:chemotaxis protein CheD [Fulvivirgaceae bacterium BMA12]|uniref:Probable chemoreceptor glutamine deamidase CheD n=1 Tax=Agaribacillus aureus TaxID=3051825 RepID=A0ABT8L4R7_9BACT|nr:chemotaxis protein CheD [Fulvivirgaceae bacterium BMA12]